MVAVLRVWFVDLASTATFWQLAWSTAISRDSISLNENHHSMVILLIPSTVGSLVVDYNE